MLCAVAITSVKITTGRGRSLYTITPNAFPATRYNVKKEDDDTNIEYVQVRICESVLTQTGQKA